ncbi:MAG: hypothetical protein GXZ06_09090 [Tissierellia bacterium]|nr:hypothetical protein [Tissierellia bacterium]
MYGLLRDLGDIVDDFLALVFITIAVLILLLDRNKYKEKSNSREFNLIRAISYSYIALGIIIFVLLRIY